MNSNEPFMNYTLLVNEIWLNFGDLKNKKRLEQLL